MGIFLVLAGVFGTLGITLWWIEKNYKKNREFFGDDS